MGVFVCRGQFDRAASLFVRFLGRIGAEQRLGANGANGRPVGHFGHELVADGQSADVIARVQRGDCRIDQIVNFRFVHRCSDSRCKPTPAPIVKEHSIVA